MSVFPTAIFFMKKNVCVKGKMQTLGCELLTLCVFSLLQATEISITECAMEKSEKYSFIIRHCKNFKDMLVNGLTGSPILAQVG